MGWWSFDVDEREEIHSVVAGRTFLGSHRLRDTGASTSLNVRTACRSGLLVVLSVRRSQVTQKPTK